MVAELLLMPGITTEYLQNLNILIISHPRMGWKMIRILKIQN